MSHSPEPWEPVGGWVYSNNEPIGRFCDGNRPETIERDIANALRAAACVNACAGIPTDKLQDCHFGQRRFIAVDQGCLEEVRKILNDAMLEGRIVELLPEKKEAK